jgi:hypothetical protein
MKRKNEMRYEINDSTLISTGDFQLLIYGVENTPIDSHSS